MALLAVIMSMGTWTPGPICLMHLHLRAKTRRNHALPVRRGRSGQLIGTSTPVQITWLLAAVTKGDPSAFGRLYEATCAKLYGVVLRIVRRQDLAAQVM